MFKIVYIFSILFLFSCKDKKYKDNKNLESINGATTHNADNQKKENNSSALQDTLKIKYSEHKNLLNILTILPDSTMRSWRWPKSERIEFIKSIEKNDFTIGSPEHFSSISLQQPNTLFIKVVDGSWILSVYRVKSNNYIVITDDVVGDGNDIQSYEYDNGQLRFLKFKDLFDKFLTELLIDKSNQNCIDLLEDNRIGFEYVFSGTTRLKISNSYYLKESKNENCLTGNTLEYLFNPTTKKFGLRKISWEKLTEE